MSSSRDSVKERIRAISSRVYSSETETASLSAPSTASKDCAPRVKERMASSKLVSSNSPSRRTRGLSRRSSFAGRNRSSSKRPLTQRRPPETSQFSTGRALSNMLPVLSSIWEQPTEQPAQVVRVCLLSRGTCLCTGRRSCKAPTGQSSTHCPQEIQSVSCSLRSAAGIIRESKPRSARPKA